MAVMFAVHRPLVRGYDGHEVALPSRTAAQAEDWLGRWATRLYRIKAAAMPASPQNLGHSPSLFSITNRWSRPPSEMVERRCVVLQAWADCVKPKTKARQSKAKAGKKPVLELVVIENPVMFDQLLVV